MYQPAAVHAVGETHDTATRLSREWEWLGLGTIDQRVPFQDSMSVFSDLFPKPVAENPAAMQTFGETHETPLKPLSARGLGLGTIDHRVPFQDSMSVSSCPLLVTEYPAAVHAAAETHETPRRSELGPGLGLGTTDHRVPSQDSIRISFCLLEYPAAVHAVAETHDMPLRVSPLGLRLGTTDQRVPSQDSMSVLWGPLVREAPTAMHAAAETHDTLVR
jgi:hypothetical protein